MVKNAISTAKLTNDKKDNIVISQVSQDKIDKASLVPMLWAMIRVVESTADVSATKMRSGAS